MFPCECAQGSKCGRKFCSFSFRVNESIHGEKEQAVFSFSRERFHRFIVSSKTSCQQMQTVAAFSETGLECHRETLARPLHGNHSADSHRLRQLANCRGQVQGMALSKSVPKRATTAEANSHKLQKTLGEGLVVLSTALCQLIWGDHQENPDSTHMSQISRWYKSTQTLDLGQISRKSVRELIKLQ